MSVEVLNFGCRLNLAEGESLRRLLEGTSPLTVINSCAVTNEAVRQGRQAVRRAARARPGVPVLVTGCGAEIDHLAYRAMPEVTQVIANKNKLDPASYGLPGPHLDAPAITGGNRARAFVEVQTGCDHACTFCVIHVARGPSRSHPEPGIVRAITERVDAGVKEVVLTGVDVTSYTGGLAGLITAILRDVPALPRLRLSSLDPMEVDDALIALFADEPRLMPHLHLSLQSGDDLILKRMKRRHLRADAVRVVERVKRVRPDVATGADLIAGFPTESEAAHANSLSILDACDVVHAHIFPFSARAGTPAARMPQLSPSLVKQRAAELRVRAAGRRTAWLRSLAGSTQNILVERDGESGHAENFAPVRTSAPPNTVIRARILNADGDRLLGEAA